MRYMIIVKATEDSEAGHLPGEELINEMAAFHEGLANAGVLLDASGLQASSKGWRIKYPGKERTLIDGPFTETRERVAGYTIIEVNSRQEAVAWTRSFPNPAMDGKGAANSAYTPRLQKSEGLKMPFSTLWPSFFAAVGSTIGKISCSSGRTSKQLVGGHEMKDAFFDRSWYFQACPLILTYL